MSQTPKQADATAAWFLLSLRFISHYLKQFISGSLPTVRLERRMHVLCFFFSFARILALFCFCLTESEQKRRKELRVHCASVIVSPLLLPSLPEFLWNSSFRVIVPHTGHKQKRSNVLMIILQRKGVWGRHLTIWCSAITEPYVTNPIQRVWVGSFL